MFASRPMFVERCNAQEVAEAVRAAEPLACLGPLSTAAVDGRYKEGFHRTPTTLVTSDLPMPEIVVDDAAPVEKVEAGRVVELCEKGYSADVANALGVLEVGLISARISDQAAPIASSHVAAVMGTPGAFEAAMAECTGADTAEAWQVLAAVVPDHVAERCRILAQRADAAGRSSLTSGR